MQEQNSNNIEMMPNQDQQSYQNQQSYDSQQEAFNLFGQQQQMVQQQSQQQPKEQQPTQQNKQLNKFIGQQQFEKLKLDKKVIQFYYNQYYGDDFIQLFQFKSQIQEIKSVCAKNISRGQTIIQCYDCATDNTCIQCMPCFKNSNHQGHRVVIKKAYGGCCDCGDIQAWKKQGFCSKHTGQAIDIQIDPKQAEYFVRIWKQLFYLMFREYYIEKQKGFLSNYKKISNKLVSNMTYLNQKGLYYNKLTYLVFSSIINEPEYKISQLVNKQSILLNLLTPNISDFIINQWMQIFTLMFAYYPFKKLLLSTYIKNFTLIYNQKENSLNKGSSISCQLLTSYQLVKEYALQKDSFPLGYDLNKVMSLNVMQNLHYVLYHDIKYITKLSEDTPQIYFKFHFRNKKAFINLFNYTQCLRHQLQHTSSYALNFTYAKYCKYFQLQYHLLGILSKSSGILIKDKQTLSILIKYLLQQIYPKQSPLSMIMFKPLHRSLGLFLFSYFDMNMTKINNKQNLDYLFKNILNLTDGQIKKYINKIFYQYIQTYLFYSKIMNSPGLNSTLYAYLYFYKIKNRFIISLDGLVIKMLMVIMRIYNIQVVIQPERYIDEQKAIKDNDQLSIISHLMLILSQLNLCVSSKSNQIYIAYQCLQYTKAKYQYQQMYKEYVQKLLITLMNHQKGVLSLANVKNIQQAFFHPDIDLAKNYLKKIATFDKIKKMFNLNKQYDITTKDQSIDLINYQDFRCNLTNKNQFQHPQKTLNLIKNNYNQQIYNQLFFKKTLSRFIIKANTIRSHIISSSSQNNQITKINDKLKPFISQIFKIIYIKKQTHKNNQQIQQLISLLKQIPNIDNLINSFHKQILYSNMIQQINDKIIIQFKSSQKLIKEEQQQKKKMLKEKLQAKKKKLNAKFQKNTQIFEDNQKKELQNIENKIINEQDAQLSCIICKNDQKTFDMIYLVNIKYKNYQKLLSLGEGVLCFSVQSCYHSIDYKCYQQIQSQLIKYSNIKKCPLCKFQSNTFLPINSQNKKISRKSLQQLQLTLQSLKQFDQISLLQQIIKSFYHYALLSYLDPQKTINKRLKIYKIILNILKINNGELYNFNKVYDRFFENRMNLNPKIKQNNKKNKLKTKQQKVQEILQLLGAGQQYQRQILINSNEQFINSTYESLFNQSINNNQSHNQQSNASPSGIFSNILEKIKQTFMNNNNTKQQLQIKNYNQRKNTIILQQTFRRVFQYIGMKSFKQQQQKNNKIQQQLAPGVQIGLNALFNHQYKSHNIFELNQNNNLLKLRQLPMNYRPLGKLNKCNNCHQISSEIYLCLLCDFKCCKSKCLMNKIMSQQRDKIGGIFEHSQMHGEESICMELSTCRVVLLNNNRGKYQNDVIYKDEYGNEFSMKQDWDKFYLDQDILNKIKIKFLHDQ